MPRVSKARWRCGNHEEVPHKQERSGDERGHEPLDAPLDEACLEFGFLVAVHAAGRDKCPDAGERCAHAHTHEEARPVGGIEERIPELAGFCACARDGEPGVSGRKHEGENAVNDDQRGR